MFEALHQTTEQLTQTLNLLDLKKEIVQQQEIKQERPCPFPKHTGYKNVWKTLTPKQKIYMEENIRITSDNKIEIVKMNKKFSILSATQNDKDIIEGSSRDQFGNMGTPGLSYFTSEAAAREAKNGGKKILKDIIQAKTFLNYFPGAGFQDKVSNLKQLFNLEKTGWYNRNKKWCFMSTFFVRLSGVYGVDGLLIEDMNINNCPSNSRYVQIVYEDCNLEKLAAEKAKAEAEKLAAEKAKAEAEKLAAEKAKAEAEKLAAEKAKAEAEKLAAEKAKNEIKVDSGRYFKSEQGFYFFENYSTRKIIPITPETYDRILKKQQTPIQNIKP